MRRTRTREGAPPTIPVARGVAGRWGQPRRGGSTTMASSAYCISSVFQAIGQAWYIWRASGCGTWILSRALSPSCASAWSRTASAMVKPYARWLSEDYFIFHVREEAGAPSAADLTRDHGREIAQIVRGDKLRLSEGECAEVLQSRISYYENDLTVVGWNAAFLYDTNAGAETAIQFSNTQTRSSWNFATTMNCSQDPRQRIPVVGTKKGMLSRWRMSRSATRLHSVLLEIGELTERADNSIKFLSDMFAARLYRLAAARVGVPDYKDLVAQKMKTAEDLYHDMVEQFNQARGFFLEV